MQDFRKLSVWQRAHALALSVYKLTQEFPREELFGLRNSLRKTSVDIPAYIAEGCGKPTDSEFRDRSGPLRVSLIGLNIIASWLSISE